jgi:hypothetical protein
VVEAKRASLPKEALPNAKGAVTIVIRMPDWKSRGNTEIRPASVKLISVAGQLQVS